MNYRLLLSHVREAYQEVRATPRPADAVLSQYLRARKYLGSNDRRFISETIYGLLREEIFLERCSRAALSELCLPEKFLTTFSIYFFLLKCSTLPAAELSAAIQTLTSLSSETLAQTAQYFLARRKPPEGNDVDALSLRHSFPNWMTELLLQEHAPKILDDLYRALNAPAPLTLRVNSLRTSPLSLQKELRQLGIETTAGRLSPDALLCDARKQVMQTPLFKQGLFEVQDEGSQLISLLLNPKPSMKVFDACAGGGGKTLHLATLMRGKGTVYAYDAVERRFGNITQRIRRSGLQNVQVIDSPKKFSHFNSAFAGKLDAVLVDAPCTGSGTVRRNPDLKRRLTKDSLERISATQQDILDAYAGFVKQGGTLVYATCSLFSAENDAVVKHFLERHPEFSVKPISMQLGEMRVSFDLSALTARFANSDYMKLAPHTDGTDGFFAAILTKHSPKS